MNALISLLSAGRAQDAEAGARAGLTRFPDAGPLWQIFAAAQSMQGKDALAALTRAAQLSPGDPGAHNNLGNALGRQGRFEAALECYRRAIALKPDFIEAHNNCVSALLDLRRFEAALAQGRRAVEVGPGDAAARLNLGHTLQGLGRGEEAVASYRLALQIAPASAEAHHSLGLALQDLERTDAAIASFAQAIALQPGFTEAHVNLGNALRSQGRLHEAVASYRQALMLSPRFAEAYVNLGNALRVLGRLDEAVASYGRAIEIRPEMAEAHGLMGTALRRQGQTAQAEACCLQALALNPRLDAALVTLAELCTDLGRFDQAEAYYRRAIAAAPDSPEGWAGLARVRKMTTADASWLTEAERVVSRALPAQRELVLRYAMGKYFDDVEDYDRAFENYRRANALAKLSSPPYDRKALTQTVDSIIQTCDSTWIARMRGETEGSERAVFIVGMPRSGTTLTEQILASHPSVFGAGELEFWNTALSNAKPPATGLDLEDPVIRTLGARYLRYVAELSAGALRVIDKNPINFPFLGLIHACLPRARIIHMRRDPIDTCLSNYFQNFENSLAHSNDLEDIVHYYEQYKRLMSHWRRTLPADVMIDLPYESLVADQEHWSRVLCKFIDLPWDVRCLDFEKTERKVFTASSWQVRQKISKGSVERWRNYEKFAGPLLGLLDDGS